MSERPPLRVALEDYLSLRRALGFKLQTAGRLLGQFVSHLEERGLDTITIDDALEWVSLPAEASAYWRAIRLSAVRGFAAYLAAIDPKVQVPPPAMMRNGPCRATPYLYSAAEIVSLLEAARALGPPLRAATYETLLGLLSVSGLRVGEAIALDVDDLDREDGSLLIRNAKFKKSRLVPLHTTTLEALGRYLEQRASLCRRSIGPALFISSRGTRLHQSNVNLTFTTLVRAAGIARRSASCRPRLHDLRHSLAVNSLLDWYREGADVAAMLPRLSTLLGHTDPEHTYWYLSAAPELMALVGERLDAHLLGRP
jgi:integrase/recombinase XerD